MALITDVTQSETVYMDVNDIHIKLKVVKKSGKKVRVCIDAPQEVSIEKRESDPKK
jgi:sRNA-binding carbon storage regulator CsrA